MFGVTRLPGGAPAGLVGSGRRAVRLSEDAWTAVAVAAAAAHPFECCGALVGDVAPDAIRVHVAWQAANTAGDPRRRYEIAADEVRALDTRARGAGLQVVGYYHSHPDRAPEPSPTDLELGLPGLVYLIVQTAASGVGRARAWRMDEDRSGFREEELTLG